MDLADGRTFDELVHLLLKRQGNMHTAISTDDSLSDLEFDSIDMVYVLSHFERQYDAEFNDEAFNVASYGTVGDLARAIDSRIHG